MSLFLVQAETADEFLKMACHLHEGVGGIRDLGNRCGLFFSNTSDLRAAVVYFFQSSHDALDVLCNSGDRLENLRRMRPLSFTCSRAMSARWAPTPSRLPPPNSLLNLSISSPISAPPVMFVLPGA